MRVGKGQVVAFFWLLYSLLIDKWARLLNRNEVVPSGQKSEAKKLIKKLNLAIFE